MLGIDGTMDATVMWQKGRAMNTNSRKAKDSGCFYEIQYVVHPRPITHGCDVYACYRLSATDGMPIGPLVWIADVDFEPVALPKATPTPLERAK